jgi:hypothetical protein
MWRRRNDTRPVRPAGQRIGDGDVILMHGQGGRRAELLGPTQERPVQWSDPSPPVATDSGRVRPLAQGRRPT